jgi:hypothetical protein
MRDNSLSKGRVKCHEVISKSIEREDRVCCILTVFVMKIFKLKKIEKIVTHSA